MIWLRLKLDLLPCIAQEVERVSMEYMELVDQVRGGDRIAYKNLVLKQANIRTRIEEFEKFYDKFYADYRIGYFEKLKLRLRKLLSPHIDVNKMIYQDTQGVRKAEIQQRRGQSKDKESVSPYRNNNDDSISSKPSITPQSKLNGNSSSAQQNNLLYLQQQAKSMYQKKMQGNSQQQSFLQLQEPSDSQIVPQGYDDQSRSFAGLNSNNNKNQSRNELGQVNSPQRNIESIIQKPTITNKVTKGKNASKSPTPVQKQSLNNSKVPTTVNSQRNIKTATPTSAVNKKSTLPGNQIATQKPQDQQGQQNQQNQKSSVDEIVFTIRMTKEDYLKYLQQKSVKNK